MSIFWNIFFWLALVAVAGIIAWTVVRIVGKTTEARKYIADAQNGGQYKALAEQAQATQAEVAARLVTIDARLAAVEKTLTDIP